MLVYVGCVSLTDQLRVDGSLKYTDSDFCMGPERIKKFTVELRTYNGGHPC